MAYPILLWFVNYSNASSVAVVVICFIIMTIFIALVSMNADFSRRSSPVTGVEQRNMVKVVNPFVLQLEQQQKSLKDGLKIHLSSLCPCKAVILWGVKIHAFHDSILKYGHEIRRGLLSEDASVNDELDCLHMDSFHFSQSGDRDISVPCPMTVSASALGDVPRQRYPVALFVLVPESDGQTCSLEDGESECSNNIVGSISVIHLKDDIVPQPSHVIAQYVKTAGIPIYSLKPLYVTTPVERQGPERSSTSETEAPDSPPESQPVSGHGAERPAEPSDSLSSPAKPGHCNKERLSATSLPGEATSDNESEIFLSGADSSSPPHELPSTDDVSNQVVRRRKWEPSSTDRDGQVPTERGSQTEQREDSGAECQESSDGAQQSDSENQPSLAECVVCQTRRAVCVLLPCRHACVCYGCFKLLDRCPMCRGSLESYFILSGYGEEEGDAGDGEDDEDDNAIQEMEHQAVNASFTEMWERFNMRLNDLLGFR